MTEDAQYSADPMMIFVPANSGSLGYPVAKTQKRPFVKYKTKCGLEKREFTSMQSMWERKKLYALLKNGEIAVAPDKVVAKTVGFDADSYTEFAKQMCLKMEENVRQGVGKKISVHWFKEGGVEGGGESAGTEAPSVIDAERVGS